MSVRAITLISRTVLVESLRRKEIYTIVLASVGLMALTLSFDFFNLDGLIKFYREAALKIMNTVTGVTAIILAARQLPREFEHRTLYMLLARPVSRHTFLVGKLLGILLAAWFCYALFMLVFIAGTWMLDGAIPWLFLVQHIYLQSIMLLVLIAACFWLSLVFNLDATISLGVVFYLVGSVYSSIMMHLYEFTTGLGRLFLVIMNYLIPQLTLFDLSDKVVHSDTWSPLTFGALGAVTLYGLGFACVYYVFAWFCFRRRAL